MFIAGFGQLQLIDSGVVFGRDCTATIWQGAASAATEATQPGGAGIISISQLLYEILAGNKNIDIRLQFLRDATYVLTCKALALDVYLKRRARAMCVA